MNDNELIEYNDAQLINQSTELSETNASRDKLVYLGTMQLDSYKGLREVKELTRASLECKLYNETGYKPSTGDRLEVWCRWRPQGHLRVGEVIQAEIVDIKTKNLIGTNDE